jgi:hypothetical protein
MPCASPSSSGKTCPGVERGELFTPSPFAADNSFRGVPHFVYDGSGP